MYDGVTMYESGLADVYDLVYRGRGKDYAAEAADVATLIRSKRPEAASLLDVACGTGLHLHGFGAQFEERAGVDLSEDMLAVAKRRNPDVPLHHGDMADFALGRTFDAVTCMFSSIALMPTTELLDKAAASLVRHLVPGGVVVCEPWWFPETFLDGYVAAHLVEVDGYKVARVSHSRRVNNATLIHEQFMVVHPASGIRHFTNSLENTLFTRGDYEEAFRKAGCPVDYLEGGPSGRGLFVGVRG